MAVVGNAKLLLNLFISSLKSTKVRRTVASEISSPTHSSLSLSCAIYLQGAEALLYRSYARYFDELHFIPWYKRMDSKYAKE